MRTEHFKSRRAFTLVEMLIVISIIGVLVALLFPAISAVRASARKAQCQNNLRSFGQSFQALAAADPNGAFCSGAFNWVTDGAVTEIGWVADIVNSGGGRPGEMLCPSNEGRFSQTYLDLLTLPTSQISNDAVLMTGREPALNPLGESVGAPCYEIANTPLEPGDQRTALVLDQVYEEGYNSNYTASWYLVRSAPLIDRTGNISVRDPSLPGGLRTLNSTEGPLTQRFADQYAGGQANIPLMGDAGLVPATLPVEMGETTIGSLMVKDFTKGPRTKLAFSPPQFDSAAQQQKSFWWKVWAQETIQDYSDFAPVHAHSANILFADGSVMSFKDSNRDGVLNSGFFANAGPFADNVNELQIQDVKDVATVYRLTDKSATKAQ